MSSTRAFTSNQSSIVGRLAIVVSMIALSACATSDYGRRGATVAAPIPPTRLLPACTANDAPFECDRRAILAMQGEYKVAFHFDETVPLQAGYVPKPDKDSGGHEWVVLVEDSGTRIVLQHILQTDKGYITKHWRQNWQYEATEHWTYVGDQRFERHSRTPAEAAGTWTQLVYEVSDAPRYAGSGKWNHRYGSATWTSERTWRPLPRREYTTRSDYQLLNVENRHTITPHGWTHEQDNTKVIRSADRPDTSLVREFGFNDYTLVEGFDFGPARKYWTETGPYWAAVRAQWDTLLAEHNAIRLNYPANEEMFLVEVLEQAERFRESRDLDAASAWLATRLAEKVEGTDAALSNR